jgi:hypothetical protein
MGFGGGGGGALPNHEHTNIALDGGPLDFDNTTVASLANGSIAYSNGVALQELPIGATGFVLGTAAGTVPTWEASGASAVMTVNGQIVYFDGSRQALNIGNLGDVLTVSAGSLPVWSALPASGPSFSFLNAQIAGTFNTTSTVMVTCQTLTLTQTSGRFLASHMGAHQSNVAGHYCDMGLTLDGLQMEHDLRFSTDLPINSTHPHCVQFWGSSSVVDVDFVCRTGNSVATCTIHAMSSLDIMEIY